MSVDKHKEIYENIKNIARDYKVDILIPTARIENSHALDYNLPDSKNIITMFDNVISVRRNASAMSINPVIIKNRKPCEITQYIKAKDKEGLKNYLKKLYEEEQDIQSRKHTVNYKFLSNFTYLLNEKPDEYELFFHILEKSQLFKEVISNTDNFWIKVAFNAKDYSFLRKKVALQTIIEYEDIQELLKNENSNTILKELLEESTFIDYLENNLNIKNFIGKELLNFNNKECLKIILSSINMNKTINFTELYQQYAKNYENVNKDTLEFDGFNETIKDIILYSNYDFKKEDAQLEVLNEENQQLISKKVLNSKLHESLIAKDKDKLKLKKI